MHEYKYRWNSYLHQSGSANVSWHTEYIYKDFDYMYTVETTDLLLSIFCTFIGREWAENRITTSFWTSAGNLANSAWTFSAKALG